jgi:hypothetical protein
MARRIDQTELELLLFRIRWGFYGVLRFTR